MTILAGIDYSFCSPAICVFDTTKELTFENLKFFNSNRINLKLAGVYGYNNIIINRFVDYSSEEERYRNVCKWASDILIDNMVEEVCIEGYSFGATSGLVFNIAENGGLIKQFMNINGIPFTSPSPSEVKKAFTGKGNSKKEQMVDEFNKRIGIKLHEVMNVKEYSKPIDDIADSYAVLLMHHSFPHNKGKNEPTKTSPTKTLTTKTTTKTATATKNL